MKKFYAVKSGRIPGIYETWEECREQVSGYSGAVYKSFKTVAEAKAFVLGNEVKSEKSIKSPTESERSTDGDRPAAYVDGSYNAKTGEFSYGAVILLCGGGEHIAFEKFSDPALAEMHNVAGELKGAEFAMRYCVQHGITKLDLYHDYEGIAAWAQGRWKTNKDGTRAYKAFYDEIKSSVHVNFVKVKGHSGDKYNDMADKLAKEALGLL